MGVNSILWFRKGLRLHDNPALHAALKDCDNLYPVFCLDPWFLKPEKVGVNRISFLLESLADLDNSFKARGTRLLVLKGNPLELIPKLFKEWGVKRLCFEADTEPYAKERDAKILQLAAAVGVEVHTPISHTLFDGDAFVKANKGKPPTAYGAFLKLADRLGPPPEPAPDAPQQLPPFKAGAPHTGGSEMEVPALEEIGYHQAPSTSFTGGETLALARLADQLADEDWVVQFEKPKGDPSAWPKPATTVLSPYLKFGCLSARLFWAKLHQAVTFWIRKRLPTHIETSQAVPETDCLAICSTCNASAVRVAVQIEQGRAQVTKPPTSLKGQLMWREFFYCVGSHTDHFDRMVGNPICKQIGWDNNEEFYQAWDQAKTGYPWIDACMMQLHKEGWLHHLARHAVACFLTRGDLYVSWERGRDTFDRLLIDDDYFINNGNWMWLSASAFFFQYYRVYSPVTFGKKYDKEGKFIRHFIPVLKTFPAKYIYEPWKAPMADQKKANCIIGKDYPKPLVDHQEVHKANIQRHKDAYAHQEEVGDRAEQELVAELEQHQHAAENVEAPHSAGKGKGPATSPNKRSRAAVQQEAAASPAEEESEQESTPEGKMIAAVQQVVGTDAASKLGTSPGAKGTLARAKAGGKGKGQMPAKRARPRSTGKGKEPELQAADASKDMAEDDGDVEVPDRGKAPAGRPGKRKPAAEAGTDEDPSKAMYDQAPKPKKPRQGQ